MLLVSARARSLSKEPRNHYETHPVPVAAVRNIRSAAMDLEVQRAISTILRGGEPVRRMLLERMANIELEAAAVRLAEAGDDGIKALLAHWPVLRHTGTARRWDPVRYQIEDQEEWGRWSQEIPEITFPPEWRIRMRPPTVGAIVRFDCNGISVYLDCYAKLGAWNVPYWEIHPSEDGDCERFEMNDVVGLLDGLRRAHEQAT